MKADLVIEGRAYIRGRIRYAEVAVDDGKIVAVGSQLDGEDRMTLGTSDVLFPGFMDPHVHFRDPGLTHKEDFYTGSLAAVHAGVTCVLDMPNTKPPVTDVDTLLEKKAVVRGRSCVDYGLFAAVTPGINAGMLAPMVPGFKLFMGSTTGNILLNDDEELIPAVTDALNTGKRMSVHAEDESMMSHEVERCTRDHLRNRPVEAEWNAISRLAKAFPGRKVNICHITTSHGLDLAKAAGFTTEVTLHHALFNVDRHVSAKFKVNPPIRDAKTSMELLKRMTYGHIDMFGSDHAPHTEDEKSREFDEAPGGMPGVETTIPIALSLARDQLMTLEDVVRMGAEAPCDAFSVNKGRIEVGRDADFAVVDLRRSAPIDVKRLHSKCGYSVYGGVKAVFPDTVIMRGEVQVKDGEFCGEPIGVDICG